MKSFVLISAPVQQSSNSGKLLEGTSRYLLMC
jgi:hypothetical protein